MSNLSVARGGVVLLEGVSFEVGAGDALVLRGPNGSGKTTLLRSVARLQPTVSGEISGHSEDIAYAAHADGVKSTLTVRENLVFWARVFGTDRVDHAVEAMDLVRLQDRPAGTLSAGQKRRLGLARMLVTGRPLWLFDEPTVSLDAPSVALFATCVQTHLAGGGAAIIATHIDLGLQGRTLDLGPYRARLPERDAFDEAFG